MTLILGLSQWGSILGVGLGLLNMDSGSCGFSSDWGKGMESSLCSEVGLEFVCVCGGSGDCGGSFGLDVYSVLWAVGEE